MKSAVEFTDTLGNQCDGTKHSKEFLASKSVSRISHVNFFVKVVEKLQKTERAMIGRLNKAVDHVHLFCPERNKVRKTGTTISFLNECLSDVVTASLRDCND